MSYLVLKTSPLESILFTLATSLSYTVSLTTSFFTTSLSLLKSRGTDTTNFQISNLSTSVYKLAKFGFSAKLDHFFINPSIKSIIISFQFDI